MKAIIACRTLTDAIIAGNAPAGCVTRTCRMCGKAVLMTATGQAQEAEYDALVLCNDCAQEAIRHVTEVTGMVMNPEAQAQVERSPEARRRYEAMLREYRAKGRR